VIVLVAQFLDQAVEIDEPRRPSPGGGREDDR
jgi:hypothetical protein